MWAGIIGKSAVRDGHGFTVGNGAAVPGGVIAEECAVGQAGGVPHKCYGAAAARC